VGGEPYTVKAVRTVRRGGYLSKKIEKSSYPTAPWVYK
jgi:hypothetical protein